MIDIFQTYHEKFIEHLSLGYWDTYLCYWNNTTLNIKPLILELPCYIIDPKIDDFLICPWQARHKKIIRNDTEQYFCLQWKICCSLAYYSDQSSSWSTSKSKNQLRIRKRMLSVWKLVACSTNYQDIEIIGSLSTICKIFLNPYHLTLLWRRGFYPIFFLNFSKTVASIKFKFSIHVKLTKCYRISIDTKILM